MKNHKKLIEIKKMLPNVKITIIRTSERKTAINSRLNKITKKACSINRNIKEKKMGRSN